MVSYTELSMRFFSGVSESIAPNFEDLKLDLKKARIKMTIQEYLSTALFSCAIIFLLEIPLLSFIFGLVFQTFLFSFISSITVSIILTTIFFLFYLNYPKFTIRDKAKNIDNTLPFFSLFLSTLAGSKLPLNKVFQMATRFARYGDISKEIDSINYDMEVLGMDVNTAIERAINRTPSKNLKDMLWGLLTTSRSGGDVGIFLHERAKSSMNDYRRRLTEFSHQLTIVVEIYLTAIVLGAILFTILTSIMAGISGGMNVVVLQFLTIFIFLPLISIAFIVFLKGMTPGGD